VEHLLRAADLPRPEDGGLDRASARALASGHVPEQVLETTTSTKGDRMPSVKSPWPQRTTVWAGACLLISGLLALLQALDPSIAIVPSVPLAIPAPVLQVSSAIVRAAGFLIAAFGVRGEIGITGGSTLGTAALVVYGARDVLFVVSGWAAADGTAIPFWVGVVVTGFVVVAALAALVAGVVVFRAHVLGGIGRGALLVVGVVEVVLAVPQSIPLQAMSLLLLAAHLELVLPGLLVVLVVLGLSYLLFGRVEAVKHRVDLIKEAW
jgi:hypothetical protein